MDLHGKHLIQGLARLGHKITVITTKHSEGKNREVMGNIKIHYLQGTTFGSSRKGWKKESIRKFREITELERIDVVLSQSKAGYGIAKIASKMGIPCVAIMHGYETMVFRSGLNQTMNFGRGYARLIKAFLSCLYYSLFQEYPLLRNSSAIIAVSDGVANVFKGRPLIHSKKITRIYNGIDISIFKPSDLLRAELRRKLGIHDEDRVILFLSIVSKQKGADIAIKAFNALPRHENNRFIIAGDGDYLGEAKKLVKKLGFESKVIFPGLIPNEETVKYYNACDIFIFPTLRLESFGIVLAEAMACGKPVITSKIGSIPEVIENHKEGILVPPGDSRELARQISRVLTDRDLSNKLVQNALQKASREFGLDKMIERTVDVLESMTKQS